MSNKKELKQFNDYEYDNLFNCSNHNTKYWALIGMGPCDDPLDNVNRVLYLLNHYNGYPDNETNNLCLRSQDDIDEKFTPLEI